MQLLVYQYFVADELAGNQMPVSCHSVIRTLGRLDWLEVRKGY
jgi:hypothetical protein